MNLNDDNITNVELQDNLKIGINQNQNMIKTQMDLDYPKQTEKTALVYFTFHY